MEPLMFKNSATLQPQQQQKAIAIPTYIRRNPVIAYRLTPDGKSLILTSKTRTGQIIHFYFPSGLRYRELICRICKLPYERNEPHIKRCHTACYEKRFGK